MGKFKRRKEKDLNRRALVDKMGISGREAAPIMGAQVCFIYVQKKSGKRHALNIVGPKRKVETGMAPPLPPPLPRESDSSRTTKITTLIPPGMEWNGMKFEFQFYSLAFGIRRE